VEFFTHFIQIVLHLDQYLAVLIQDYGQWVYLILFLIIFCETGLVVTPFLPGDSLLFVTGTLAATGSMDLKTVTGLLMLAAFMGDNTNYWIGRIIGPKVFSRDGSRLLNRKHLDKTHAFYERHGGKTILFARFLPIIRTFAPFVAGIGRMAYQRFIAYSFFGAIFWIGFFILGGYFFGNLPFVKQNLTLMIFGIILLSLMPGLVGYLRQRRA
jgi:membrane-associated protein